MRGDGWRIAHQATSKKEGLIEDGGRIFIFTSDKQTDGQSSLNPTERAERETWDTTA